LPHRVLNPKIHRSSPNRVKRKTRKLINQSQQQESQHLSPNPQQALLSQVLAKVSVVRLAQVARTQGLASKPSEEVGFKRPHLHLPCRSRVQAVEWLALKVGQVLVRRGLYHLLFKSKNRFPSPSKATRLRRQAKPRSLKCLGKAAQEKLKSTSSQWQISSGLSLSRLQRTIKNSASSRRLYWTSIKNTKWRVRAVNQRFAPSSAKACANTEVTAPGPTRRIPPLT
jgi:hypothetical protein